MDSKKLSKDLFYLFVLSIVVAVASVLTSDQVSESFPALSNIGNVATLVCSIIYIFLLWSLSNFSGYYKKAAIWKILTLLIDVILVSGIIGLFFAYSSSLSHHNSFDSVLGGLAASIGLAGVLVIVVSILSLIFGLCATHNEYKAHGEVMIPYDSSYELKWHKLWKYTIWSTIAMIIALVVMILALFSKGWGLISLGTAVMMLAGIAMLVISIVKLVYLYRMSKLVEASDIIKDIHSDVIDQEENDR